MYSPPFKITNKIVSLVAEISERIGRVSASGQVPNIPHLRKQNRIRTIQASLAIEQNTLSIEQVTNIIDGKRVIGRAEEIKEVQNAFQAYELIMSYDAHSIKDLLKAHGVMMLGLVKEAGRFRSGGVGVFGEQGLVHLAPPADLVPTHIKNLFDWYAQSDLHVLIKSAIFHYEFEFIHPFADGNGRMGRMWHSKLMSEWNPVFYWLPVEDMIREHQQDYYKALSVSDDNAESTIFVELMLTLIKETLDEYIKDQNALLEKSSQESIQESNQEILNIISSNPTVTISQLSNMTGLSTSGIKKRLPALKEKGLIIHEGSTKAGRWIVKKVNME